MPGWSHVVPSMLRLPQPLHSSGHRRAPAMGNSPSGAAFDAGVILRCGSQTEACLPAWNQQPIQGSSG
jgi:hypothetical protein